MAALSANDRELTIHSKWVIVSFGQMYVTQSFRVQLLAWRDYDSLLCLVELYICSCEYFVWIYGEFWTYIIRLFRKYKKMVGSFKKSRKNNSSITKHFHVNKSVLSWKGLLSLYFLDCQKIKNVDAFVCSLWMCGLDLLRNSRLSLYVMIVDLKIFCSIFFRPTSVHHSSFLFLFL